MKNFIPHLDRIKKVLLGIFTQEEPIGGLEISADFVRLVLLETKEDKKTGEIAIQTKFSVQEPLPKGCLQNGRLKNPSALAGALKNLLKKAKIKIKYVVVSLPSENIYTKIFNFPDSLKDRKLTEAMKLITDFQLPKNSQESFFDWQKISAKENRYLLAMISKNIADELIKTINYAGLKIIAVEFHPLSLSRAAALPDEGNTIIKAGSAIYIFSKNILRFAKTLPQDFATKENLESEIKKITYFCEAEFGPIGQSLEFAQIEIRPELCLFPPQNRAGRSEWLVSLGAATRGLLPRSQDVFISLMPVGTEQAYEHQKAASFVEFIANLIIGLSIFSVLAFGATWGLMNYLQQKSLSISLSGVESATGDIDALEAKTQQLNALISAGATIIKQTPRWSILLEELETKVSPGIFITSLSLASPPSSFTLTGIAQNRAQLNAFKKSLESSSLFTKIVLPLTSLDVKSEIPFSISMEIKDPSSLYIK